MVHLVPKENNLRTSYYYYYYYYYFIFLAQQNETLSGFIAKTIAKCYSQQQLTVLT